MVMQAAKGAASADPFSRAEADARELSPPLPATFRFGLPRPQDLNFFGDREAPALFARAIPVLESMGGQRVEIDFTPFRETAQLLYGGPWVAERLAALKDFYAAHADAFLPVTRKIIGGGSRYTAVDVFEAQYRLQELKNWTAKAWATIDVLLVPTAGTVTPRASRSRTHATEHQPPATTRTSSACSTSARGGAVRFRQNELPFGVTLITPAFRMGRLCTLGAEFHAYRRQTRSDQEFAAGRRTAELAVHAG